MGKSYHKIRRNMKKIIVAIALFFLTGCNTKKVQYDTQKDTNKPMTTKSIHQFIVKDIQGNDFDLSTLKGKKVLIVNTASKCGLTPQFEQLQQIYETYKSDNFEIIGFPSNDFLEQDPGSNEEIVSFCQLNYGVTFPMMEKVVVKGENKAPIYKYLTSKEENGIQDFDIQWNFQKFLINEDGQIEKVISPRTLPNDEEIIRWITSK